MMDNNQFSQLYEEYRSLLMAVAYRMLGSVPDAEDIVQDTFLALQQQTGQIAHLKTYLCKMVTNRCINELRSARKTRTSYIGPWLPEPIVESAPPDQYESQENIAYAYIVLMEQLTPAERAVFILRETLDFSYDEIAAIINKTPANCRKIFSRSRQKMNQAQQQEQCSLTSLDLNPLSAAFSKAYLAGDLEQIVQLLSDKVTLYCDGGGKVRTAINPIYGKDRVSRLLAYYITSHHQEETLRLLPVLVNGSSGMLLMRNNKAEGVFAFAASAAEDFRLSAIYFIKNPDKLREAQHFCVTNQAAHLS
ncbi:RNA polymerase sigma factor SigJ [Paenibacillus sp. GCM10027626]|uniref:RNA polymerase sigma factor SigJ n=1 Tax=Paenibacillus sp. GCM10027626 TaxID=3273411 RepID=UPI00362D29E4